MIHRHITGNIGLYYVCYRLSRLGWNIMPTARNARGIDIVAYDAPGEQFLGFQIKTLSRRYPVPLGTGLVRLMGNWWIIVTHAAQERPISYVLLPDEVRQLAHRNEKEGRISYWLEPSGYDNERFRERWDRLPAATR